MKLNYHYKIRFKKVYEFEFKRYNAIVDLTEYKDRIMPQLQSVCNKLYRDNSNRRAIIIVDTNPKDRSCLTYIQFQIYKNKLIVIANFRSQCKTNGRPVDSQMLRFISTIVMRELNLEKYKIFVNVGNYHTNVNWVCS